MRSVILVYLLFLASKCLATKLGLGHEEVDPNSNTVTPPVATCKPGRPCTQSSCSGPLPASGRTVKLDGQFGAVEETCGSTEYRFIRECLTRAEAAAYCVEEGGYLWKVETLNEYDLVKAEVGDNNYWRYHWWIGADSVGSPPSAVAAKKLRWIGGEICDWKNLYENDNKAGCVDIFAHDKWGDHTCDLKLPFICEIPDTSSCGCFYDGTYYSYGTNPIATLPHCCSNIFCIKGKGLVIENISEPKTCGCCDTPGGLLLDGGQSGNQVCCKSRILYAT